MYIKLAVYALLGLLLAIIQLAFISALPAGFNDVNLLLVVLVFVLGLASYRAAVLWSLWLGVIMDIFSFLPFGLLTLNLLLVIFVIHFLLENFFTNRSLYSFMALALFAYLIHQTILYFIFYIFALAGRIGYVAPLDSLFWVNELRALAINLILVVVFFYAFSYISRKLKPALLIKQS